MRPGPHERPSAKRRYRRLGAVPARRPPPRDLLRRPRRSRRRSSASSASACGSRSAPRSRTSPSRWRSPPTPAPSSASAATEIALLLVDAPPRLRAGRTTLDRLILREEYASLPPVAAQLGATAGGPDLRAAAQLGPAIHPALDGRPRRGVDGEGRQGALARGALDRAAPARASRRWARRGGREETPLLVALALAAETAARRARACRSACRRRRSTGTCAPPRSRATWLAARTGLARAWRDAGRGRGRPAAPPARGGALAGGAPRRARGVARRRRDALRLRSRRRGSRARTSSPARLARVRTRTPSRPRSRPRSADDGELARRAEQAVALARLRELLGAAVAAGGGGRRRSRARAAPGRCSARPARSPPRVADDAQRRGARARISRGARGARRARPSSGRRASSRALAGRRDPPRRSASTARGRAAPSTPRAAAALLADLAVDRLAAPARAAPSRSGPGARRRAGPTSSGRRGGSTGSRRAAAPILRQRRGPAGGPPLRGREGLHAPHRAPRAGVDGRVPAPRVLRADPRRGEGALRRDAAPRRPRRRRSSTTSLGDAISFSGRIDEMVALAKAIRAQFDGLRARGSRARSRPTWSPARSPRSRRSSPATLQRRARARGRRTRPRSRARRPGTPQHAALAASRLARARRGGAARGRARARARARAKGEVLEAGVFVSYGPAPLVVVIEDEVFGRNRVAIADKINESARGTARAASARGCGRTRRSRAERARRRDPAVEHAWSRVRRPTACSSSVPPDAEDHAVRLFRAGDGAGRDARARGRRCATAIEAAARAGERAGRRLQQRRRALGGGARGVPRRGGRGARGAPRRARPRAESRRRSAPRFFYGEEPLALVACFHPDGRLAELFRRVGRRRLQGARRRRRVGAVRGRGRPGRARGGAGGGVVPGRGRGGLMASAGAAG